MATAFAGSKYTKRTDLDTLNTGSDEEEEEEEEESAESGSTSSFSLQECINEFRARRIRRVSTHSRDMVGEEREPVQSAADADLINQNRCNKEQERKCKPCKNGFCYCFTSDSGDCGSTAPTREPLVRQHRRSRRSESNKAGTTNTTAAGYQTNNLDSQQQRQRQSLSSNIRKTSSNTAKPLTVISSLNAVAEEAPLIHIIQELRNNCVISEVRVNKQKLQTIGPASEPSEMVTEVPTCRNNAYQPTAPPLSSISEKETPTEDRDSRQSSLVGDSLQSSCRSSLKSSRRNSGGRLLQKRLSHGQVNFKMHDTKYPPPKPPRRGTQSLDANFSLSSLTSTTPSVREAERVVDEFLHQRGVQLPSTCVKVPKTKGKRKSYPLSEIEKKDKQAQRRQLPTCPSLSDMERIVESKRGTHYVKNIHTANSLHRKDAVADKSKKQIVLGWTEPKINDMLNYDVKSVNVDGDKPSRQKFKTQAPSAGPQSAIGWQAPHKISLDTVDGVVSENLAANIENKHTPIKYARAKRSIGARENQKFIWGEQWRNLSPWNASKRGHMTAGLRTKSKKFFNNSKNKILRFVSPKKSNQPEDPTPTRRLCTVGVQTSQLDLHALQSQSPPGSYHSPVQSCTTVRTHSASAETTSTLQHPLPRLHEDSFKQLQFDFDRKVKPPTPPKKLPRAQRARKLDFNVETTLHCAPTTYRSYHKDLDQDVTITKMGYLLSSIKAKLEASDERAMRTFRECSRFEPLERAESASFDCPDGQHIAQQHKQHQQQQQQRHELHSEPIYSEIEEDCVHIRGSPQHESRTAAVTSVSTPTHTPMPTPAPTPTPTPTPAPALGAQSATAPDNLSLLYARVQKPPKETVTPKAREPTSLAQFLQESFKNGSLFQVMPLPDEPVAESVHNMSTLPIGSHIAQPELSVELQRAPTPPLPMPIYQSLNNIHEQHSPPKQHRNLSKSDLSLQRSDIFLENLCRSEIVLDHDDNLHLEKVENAALSASTGGVDSECVSYDLPLDSPDGLYQPYSTDGEDSSFATNAQASQYGSGKIEPLPSENQSTPKKQAQIFTTKLARAVSIDTGVGQVAAKHSLSNSNSNSNSCPSTPHQQSSNSYSVNASAAKHTHSLGELTQTAAGESQMLSTSALVRYRHLKNALRRSYRKGKNFFKAETQRLASSLGMPRDQSIQTEGELDSSSSAYYAGFQLDRLMNEALSPDEQLAQAVSICRQMPDLEVSAEMVEAERLLLFSSLRCKTLQSCSEASLAARRQAQCFLIDAMHLPVKLDASQDMFFNSYYICTFECEGRISSTQSVECQNGAAVFRDCGIEFYSNGQAGDMQLRCQIFMLRLRKVSTLSLEPQKTLAKRKSLESASGSACSSNSETIVSRFRLHASFVLYASDLVPYELVASETEGSATMCLRASRCWQLPITPHTKSINLAPQIQLTGRVELRLPKARYTGYLNVQDTKNQHNWNRRWCTLVGLQLAVWQHEENLTEQPPLLSLMLQRCHNSTLDVAPREVCARLRSFQLDCDGLTICFAADTQSELSEWLAQLNEALKFAKHWFKPNSCPSSAS